MPAFAPAKAAVARCVSLLTLVPLPPVTVKVTSSLLSLLLTVAPVTTVCSAPLYTVVKPSMPLQVMLTSNCSTVSVPATYSMA